MARGLKLGFVAVLFTATLASCGGEAPVPDFDLALQAHFDSISHRDIEAFASHLTKGETLYTIVQDGRN